MTPSPYREPEDPWYELYLAETAECSALQKELWTLRDRKRFDENRPAIIFIVRPPEQESPHAGRTPSKHSVLALLYAAVVLLIFGGGIAAGLLCATLQP